MEELNTNSIMPPSGSMSLYLSETSVLSVPYFLLLGLIRIKNPNAMNDKEFSEFAIAPDKIPQKTNQEQEELILYLKKNISWNSLDPFLQASEDTRTALHYLWTERAHTLGKYSIRLERLILPPSLYRYAGYHKNRCKDILVENRLYLPSPSQFNDPFDCALDEGIRMSFIECGIGCFSAERGNVLLFSHHADRHRGFCLEFDPVTLATSVSQLNQNVRADIRPIWYSKKLPPLDFKTQPALFATIKDAIWSYEKEYRLFIADSHGGLHPSGHYSFAPEALRGIIFGFKSEENTIAEIKKMTAGRKGFSYYRSVRRPYEFGLSIEEIPKLA